MGQFRRLRHEDILNRKKPGSSGMLPWFISGSLSMGFTHDVRAGLISALRLFHRF